MRKNIYHLFSSAIFTQKFQFFLPFDSYDTLNFCDLHLFIPQEKDFDPDWLSPQVILLTQICENQGTSVCNAIEFIATQAVHFLTQNVSHFDPYNCVIVEHHNPNSYLNFDEFLETYHIFKQDLGRCYWHNLTKEDFSSLIKGEKIPNYRQIPPSFFHHRWSQTQFEKTWKSLRAFVSPLYKFTIVKL